MLPDEHRPKSKEGIACLSTKVNIKALDDVDIREIIKRWRKFSFLRELYMNGDLFREYEDFRQRSLIRANLSAGTGIPLMEPGDARGGIKTAQTKQDRLFIPGFKRRFHRGIVQHAVAIGCLQFARRAIDLPLAPADFDPAADSDAQNFKTLVTSLWSKHAVEYCDEFNCLFTEILLHSKIDFLETFDFLYVFLLPKILPFEGLASWTRNITGEYPYTDNAAKQQFTIEEWQAFLDLSRWVLQPHDLVELIEKRAWTGTYPADKSMYMQTRGMFERGESIDDSRVICGRKQMVTDLRDSSGFVLKDAEDQCWWDHIRVRCGSIFLAGSMSRYREELEKLKEAEIRDFGEGPMAAAETWRATIPFFHKEI